MDISVSIRQPIFSTRAGWAPSLWNLPDSGRDGTLVMSKKQDLLFQVYCFLQGINVR